MIFHRIEAEWATETAFIIAGGPSVLNYDLEMLRGRNVIVINSSIHAVPWANFLYFGDWRWWNEPENRAAVECFPGRVITTSRMIRDPKVKICNRKNPPGLAFQNDTLTQKVTSLTAATNLAFHLVGSGGTIIWLGADGKYAGDGRTHHHKPHPWSLGAEVYSVHMQELSTIVPTLKALQVTALNASPGTAWSELLPVIDLNEFINDRRAA